MGEVNGYDSMVDAELVLQFQEGSETAFDDLVRRHKDAAYRFCLRLTGQANEAEEISQEGFVRAYRRLGTFRGDAHFRSWLFQILINLYRDSLRAQKRGPRRESAFPDTSGPAEEVGAQVEAEELQNILHQKIRQLPDRQREVMQLHGQKELGYREIARILGCTYEDVKMNLCLARKRLKQDMAEYL